MSEYINITTDDLLKHTKDNGICYLWHVLYEYVCPDGDESKVIEHRGIDEPPMLIVDKNVNILDHGSSPIWAKDLKSINFEEIVFQKNVLINFHYARSLILDMSNVECLGVFEVLSHVKEINIIDSQFNIFFLSKNSRNIFNNCTFSDSLRLYDRKLTDSELTQCRFEKEQYFTYTTLTNCKFTNTIFQDKVDFQ
ncbi:MAG: pentapeptide repeat-containing protein, partial [Brevinema sp.]